MKRIHKDATQENPLPPGEGGRRPGEGKKPINPHLLTLARKLRKEQTDAEQLLWHLLRNRQFCGLKFRRQYPMTPYVVDFYCDEEQLGIELDGGQHNEPDKKQTDKERTAFLEGKGIKIIRFGNKKFHECSVAEHELWRSKKRTPRGTSRLTRTPAKSA